MGAARSRVDSNVEGERHTAKLNSCEEQAQSQPKRIATDPSQVITAVPNQGHECQSNSCLQNAHRSSGSYDCLLIEIGKQSGDKYGEQFSVLLAKVILLYKNGNRLKAKESLEVLSELVTTKQCSHLPLNEQYETLTTSTWRKYTKTCITIASFKTSVIPLSFDNDVSCYANALNTLGILAIELFMPEKAIELFCLQQQYLVQNSTEFVGSLEESITLNNCGISHALIGQYKKAIEYLDKARAIGSGMGEKSRVFGSCGLNVYVTVLNNLGKVYFDAGHSQQTEQLLQEASKLLKKTRCERNQRQIPALEAVLEYNTVKLFSTKRMWKPMKEKLQSILKSLCTLDLEHESQISILILAELVKVDIKMKQDKKANSKLEKILPMLENFSLWTEDSIIDELDVFLLSKVAEIFLLQGHIQRANAALKKAVKMCQVVYGVERPITAELLYKRGWVCFLLEEYEECAALISEAITIHELRYLDSCARLVSCYCKLANVELLHLDAKEKARENMERALGILNVFLQDDQQLPLRYLKQLVKAGVMDSCVSFQLTQESIYVSLSYYKAFASSSGAGKTCESSQLSEDFKVPLTFHSKNFADLLHQFAKMLLSLVRIGRISDCIRLARTAIHFSKQEGSGTSRMLFYSCLGYSQVASVDEHDKICAEESLQEGFRIANKRVHLLQHQPQPYELGPLPTKDDREVVLSSLAIMGQAYHTLRDREKEMMEVHRNMSVLLSLDANTEFSDTLAQVLGGHMIYVATHNISFQDKLVTVKIVVSEMLSVASSSASTPRSSSSHKPSLEVQHVDAHGLEQKVLVLATCQHQIDIDALRSFSKSTSESVKQSLKLRETLNVGFVVDIKPPISLKSCKALCNELELVLPLYIAEKLSNAGNQVDCSSVPPRSDPQLCSGFTRYSTLSPFIPEVLVSNFIVSSVSTSDQLGVLCDLSLRDNGVSLFLLEPKASVQVQCLGNVVELQTRSLSSVDCVSHVSASKLCGCSGVYKTVANILLQSSRSVGVDLVVQVDNRQCCTLSETPVAQEMPSLVAHENHQLPWKDEGEGQTFLAEVKGMKRCTVDAAVLQNVITGLLSQEDGKVSLAKGVDSFNNDATSRRKVAHESLGPFSALKDGALNDQLKTRKVKLTQQLLNSDSGIDSSDSEKKCATFQARTEQHVANSSEQVSNIPNASELSNSSLPGRKSKSVNQLEICDGLSCVSTAPKSVTELVAGQSCGGEDESYSPLSSSSEDGDVPSGDCTSTVRKRNTRQFRCCTTEKQPIKQWHKMEKLREVASLQRTIERLERTVQLMKGEMSEMEKNYGEALVQRDSALRMLERMKFGCELEQRSRRREGHAVGVGDGEKQEDEDNGPDGIGNGTDSKDQDDNPSRYAQSVANGGKIYIGATGLEATEHLKTELYGESGSYQHGTMGCSEKKHRTLSTTSKREDINETDGRSPAHLRTTSCMCDREQEADVMGCSDNQQRRVMCTSSNLEHFDKTDGHCCSLIPGSDQETGDTGCGEGQERKCVITSNHQNEFDKTGGQFTPHRKTSHVTDSDQRPDVSGCKEDQCRSMGTISKQEDFDKTGGQSMSRTRTTSHITDSDQGPNVIGCNEDQHRSTDTCTFSNQEDFHKTDGHSTADNRIISHVPDSDQENGTIGYIEDKQGRSMRRFSKQEEFNKPESLDSRIVDHMAAIHKEYDTIWHNNDHERRSQRTSSRQEDLVETDGQLTAHTMTTRRRESFYNESVGEDTALRTTGKLLGIASSNKSNSDKSTQGEVSKRLTFSGLKLENLADSFKEHCDEHAKDRVPENTTSCQFVSSPQHTCGQIIKFPTNKAHTVSTGEIDREQEEAVESDLIMNYKMVKTTQLDSEEMQISNPDNPSVLKQGAVKGVELLTKESEKGSCSPENGELKADHPDSGGDTEVKQMGISSVLSDSFSCNAMRCQLAEGTVCEKYIQEGKVGEREDFKPSISKPKLPEMMLDKSTRSQEDDGEDMSEKDAAVACIAVTKQTDCGVGSVGRATAAFSGVQSQKSYLEQGARPKQTRTSLTVKTHDATADIESNNQTYLEQGARPKQYHQLAAGQMSGEPNARNESFLASSPENHGLDVAFLARHSQDCSISLHSYQASDDFYLSTPPLEWNQNGTVCASNKQADRDQHLARSSRLIRTDCTPPDIPRYLWELPNPGSISGFTAQTEQITDPMQQSKCLPDYQSATPSQAVAFLMQPDETPDTSNASLSYIGEVSSRHTSPGCQSQIDNLITSSASGTHQVNCYAAVGNSYVHPQQSSLERPSNTDGDESAVEKNGEKKGIKSISCEETDTTTEDCLFEDEVESGELANVNVSGTESLQSVEETLNTLESRVAEACAMVERVFRERRAREQEAREREERAREERERVFREQEEREREEEERAARAGQDGHTTAGTDNQEPGIDGERYPVQESPQWLCEHYQRRCKVRFPCCRGYHPCHRCHNSDDRCPNKEAKAHEATHLQCIVCREEQPVTDTYETQTCQSCGTKLSEYFCPKCKHFTGVEKKPYHCDKCGICRIHKDRSFHCEVCNVCLDKRLQGKHKCRPDSGHDECCICLEDAFSGCQILPCSHKVHRDCAIAMIRNGIRTCPVCRHPLYSEADD